MNVGEMSAFELFGLIQAAFFGNFLLLFYLFSVRSIFKEESGASRWWFGGCFLVLFYFLMGGPAIMFLMSDSF